MSGKSNIKEEVLKLLPGLKAELKEEADGVSDEKLLNFLYWKPNIQRAADRFRSYKQWHTDNPWAHSEPTQLQLTQNPTLQKHVSDKIIQVPELMTTKSGSTLLIGQLRNNDMTDGRTPQDVCRMILYMIDRALERQATKEHGIVIFHDLKGLSKSNVHPLVPKLLFQAIIGHFPIRINGIYLLDAPFFFKGFFSVVSLMFPKKLKSRIHYVNSLDDIYEHVMDREKLLVEYGGDVESDTEAWVAKQKEREENGDFVSFLVE